jgi:sphingomyelin phosphodiesterase
MKYSIVIFYTLSYICICKNMTDYEIKFDELTAKFIELKRSVEERKSSAGFLEYKGHTDGIVCRTCLSIAGEIYYLATTYYDDTGMLKVASFLCHYVIGFSPEACNGFIYKFGPVLITSLLGHYMTPEYICNSPYVCSTEHYITLDSDDYARELLKDKPSNITKTTIDIVSKRWKMLHVTDIHTDLFYQVGSLGDCPDSNCCRNTPSYDIPLEKKAGPWGYIGKCDLPLKTLSHFVEKAVYNDKPDFIIWTGDNPSHSIWDANNQEEIFNITRIFTTMLLQPGIPVYPTLGNHEKFPADQFFPFEDPKQEEKPLLKFFADQWRHWLGEEAYNEFLRYGFYSKRHLDTNLRIVSYNCLYCDILNFYLIKDPTDPSGQIRWLERTLRYAELNDEVVYIIGHIPVGDTSILSECSKRIKAIIDRYSHIIRGIFGGHTHYDEVKVISEYFNKDKISAISFIAPSLTT